MASDLVAPLRSPQPPSAEAVITALVNELTTLPNSFILTICPYRHDHIIDVRYLSVQHLSLQLDSSACQLGITKPNAS